MATKYQGIAVIQIEQINLAFLKSQSILKEISFRVVPIPEAHFFGFLRNIEIEFVSVKIRKGYSRAKLTLIVLAVLNKLEI
jgi:hypothetical protein